MPEPRGSSGSPPPPPLPAAALTSSLGAASAKARASAQRSLNPEDPPDVSSAQLSRAVELATVTPATPEAAATIPRSL